MNGALVYNSKGSEVPLFDVNSLRPGPDRLDRGVYQRVAGPSTVQPNRRRLRRARHHHALIARRALGEYARAHDGKLRTGCYKRDAPGLSPGRVVVRRAADPPASYMSSFPPKLNVLSAKLAEKTLGSGSSVIGSVATGSGSSVPSISTSLYRY